uniref:Uncharacterized protein n=1 Tax=Romanomermis culicivorax TaxID=13658 RepID=A0A915K7Y7_ROMCU
MARQAEIEATVGGNVKGHQILKRQRLMTPPKTVGGNVKGHQILKRQRPMTPPKIVHPMAKMLDQIRRKSKLAWKLNLVHMNFEDYYKDSLAELYDN